MKNALIQHIRQIFEVLKINAEYSVYDSVNDILPDWLKADSLTYEFVVCCDAIFDKEKLQGFIHKDIFEICSKYIWFEGEIVKNKENHQSDIMVETLCPIQPKENLKTKTRLSSWLDNYIYDKLNAEYAPDFQKFEYNLNLSHEDNLKYLGTYFPRSYAETFCVFDNIFANDIIKSKFSILTELNILSVGCGTGGDVVGLITVINKHFASIKKINIVAIDGNKDALAILSDIISKAGLQFRKEVVIDTKQVVFDTINSIETNISFDFVITSKMINEVINKGKGRFDNSYYDFAKIYSPMLKAYGMMMILDVTTKIGNSEFCPILLNRQINKFVYEHQDFASILPIPCAVKENCQEQCFSQKEFYVSHSRFANDRSRVAYRILARRTFLQDMQLCQLNTRYQIQPDGFCGQGVSIADGFYLPNTVSTEKIKNINKETDKLSLKQCAVAKEKESRLNEVQVLKYAKKEEQNCIQHNLFGEAYLIDTNAFIYAPNIIEKISEEYPIFISAKVVDELDHRKDVTSGNDKKKVQKALKSINVAISNGRVQTITSDARLLPADFDRRSPDNLILSVALKLRKMGYTPILVTSDNGFQVKAKTLKIETIPYTKVKSKI